MRRAGALLAGLALSAAVAGCGDGRLDSGELHDKVKAACVKAHKALLLLPDPVDLPSTTKFVAGAATTTSQLLAQLRPLKPPESAQREYGYALQLMGRQLAALNAASSQLQGSGDPVVVIRRLSDTSVSIGEREKTAWQILGIPECAQR